MCILQEPAPSLPFRSDCRCFTSRRPSGFHPILDRFVICHSAPGILPFAHDDPFATIGTCLSTHAIGKLCFQQTRVASRRVASPRATCRISNVMSFPVAFLAEVETRTKGIDVGYRRAKVINGLTQIAALTRLGTFENRSSVELRAIKYIVPRFYFQEIARDVISLALI